MNAVEPEKDDTPEAPELLGGVYPGGDKLEELAVTIVYGENVEAVKVKVPSNYYIAVDYYTRNKENSPEYFPSEDFYRSGNSTIR